MIEIVEKMVRESKRMLSDGDYVKDGLYHCGKCHTPKQCKITILNEQAFPFCLCQCEKEEQDAKKLKIAEEKRQENIEKMRRDGIPDGMRDWTFENDKRLCPELLQKAKRYVKAWNKIRSENIGIVFWGSVGNGKTYSATCIANKLIDNGIPAKVTSMPKLINDLIGFHIDDKNKYVEDLSKYELLVIDDLGVERDTPTALEKAYDIIDRRCISKKPLIITTNLTLDEMKSPRNREYYRIYSRILGACVPIRCTEQSIRPTLAKEKFAAVKRFLEGENAE